MVELPKYVYELKELMVLDLRACNNLEHFPKGISSLLNLTHLDLSGCYLLNHVPIGITSLTNLQVLKGFIINKDQSPEVEKGKQKRKEKGKEKGIEGKASRTPPSTPCSFDELSVLVKLRKLTIITRRLNFPTTKDFQTFGKLEKLTCLRITWVGFVGNSPSEVQTDNEDGFDGIFLPTLTKLELQAASDKTASRVLRLIGEDTRRCGPDKLYLRGGGLRELKYSFPQPTVVRLRYLPELQIHWDDFRNLFTNLDWLQVLQCPNLILFPCDGNGVWENTQNPFDDKKGEVKKRDDEKEEIRNHENESSMSLDVATSSSSQANP